MKKRLFGILTAALIVLTSLAAALPVAAKPETITIINRVVEDSGTASGNEKIDLVDGAELSAFKLGKMLVDKDLGTAVLVPEGGFKALGNADLATADSRLQLIDAANALIESDGITTDIKGIVGEDGRKGILQLELDDESVYLIIQTGAVAGSVGEGYKLTPILATMPDDEFKQDIYAKYQRAFTPETPGTKVSVRKIWDDANDAEGIRPADIEVVLLADGSEVIGPDITDDATEVTLSASNNWSYTWERLAKYTYDDEGNQVEIKYTVKEKEVPKGYKATISDDSNKKSDVATGFVITNSHTPKKTPTPTPTVTPKGPRTTRTRKSPSPGTATRVKTGDDNNLKLLIGIIAAAVVVLIIAVVVKKRRKSDE